VSAPNRVVRKHPHHHRAHMSAPPHIHTQRGMLQATATPLTLSKSVLENPPFGSTAAVDYGTDSCDMDCCCPTSCSCRCCSATSFDTSQIVRCKRCSPRSMCRYPTTTPRCVMPVSCSAQLRSSMTSSPHPTASLRIPIHHSNPRSVVTHRCSFSDRSVSVATDRPPN